MYSLELSVFMYKFSINDLPLAFKEYFRKRSDIHDHPTRHVDDLDVINNKKSFSDHSIRACGLTLWNSLNAEIKNYKSSKSVNQL